MSSVSVSTSTSSGPPLADPLSSFLAHVVFPSYKIPTENTQYSPFLKKLLPSGPLNPGTQKERRNNVFIHSLLLCSALEKKNPQDYLQEIRQKNSFKGASIYDYEPSPEGQGQPIRWMVADATIDKIQFTFFAFSRTLNNTTFDRMFAPQKTNNTLRVVKHFKNSRGTSSGYGGLIHKEYHFAKFKDSLPPQLLADIVRFKTDDLGQRQVVFCGHGAAGAIATNLAIYHLFGQRCRPSYHFMTPGLSLVTFGCPFVIDEQMAQTVKQTAPFSFHHIAHPGDIWFRSIKLWSSLTQDTIDSDSSSEGNTFLGTVMPLLTALSEQSINIKTLGTLLPVRELAKLFFSFIKVSKYLPVYSANGLQYTMSEVDMVTPLENLTQLKKFFFPDQEKQISLFQEIFGYKGYEHHDCGFYLTRFSNFVPSQPKSTIFELSWRKPSITSIEITTTPNHQKFFISGENLFLSQISIGGSKLITITSYSDNYKSASGVESPTHVPTGPNASKSISYTTIFGERGHCTTKVTYTQPSAIISDHPPLDLIHSTMWRAVLLQLLHSQKVNLQEPDKEIPPYFDARNASSSPYKQELIEVLELLTKLFCNVNIGYFLSSPVESINESIKQFYGSAVDEKNCPKFKHILPSVHLIVNNIGSTNFPPDLIPSYMWFTEIYPKYIQNNLPHTHKNLSKIISPSNETQKNFFGVSRTSLKFSEQFSKNVARRFDTFYSKSHSSPLQFTFPQRNMEIEGFLLAWFAIFSAEIKLPRILATIRPAPGFFQRIGSYFSNTTSVKTPDTNEGILKMISKLSKYKVSPDKLLFVPNKVPLDLNTSRSIEKHTFDLQPILPLLKNYLKQPSGTLIDDYVSLDNSCFNYSEFCAYYFSEPDQRELFLNSENAASLMKQLHIGRTGLDENGLQWKHLIFSLALQPIHLHAVLYKIRKKISEKYYIGILGPTKVGKTSFLKTIINPKISTLETNFIACYPIDSPQTTNTTVIQDVSEVSTSTSSSTTSGNTTHSVKVVFLEFPGFEAQETLILVRQFMHLLNQAVFFFKSKDTSFSSDIAQSLLKNCTFPLIKAKIPVLIGCSKADEYYYNQNSMERPDWNLTIQKNFSNPLLKQYRQYLSEKEKNQIRKNKDPLPQNVLDFRIGGFSTFRFQKIHFKNIVFPIITTSCLPETSSSTDNDGASTSSKTDAKAFAKKFSLPLSDTTNPEPLDYSDKYGTFFFTPWDVASILVSRSLDQETKHNIVAKSLLDKFHIAYINFQTQRDDINLDNLYPLFKKRSKPSDFKDFIIHHSFPLSDIHHTPVSNSKSPSTPEKSRTKPTLSETNLQKEFQTFCQTRIYNYPLLSYGILTSEQVQEFFGNSGKNIPTCFELENHSYDISGKLSFLPDLASSQESDQLTASVLFGFGPKRNSKKSINSTAISIPLALSETSISPILQKMIHHLRMFPIWRGSYSCWIFQALTSDNNPVFYYLHLHPIRQDITLFIFSNSDTHIKQCSKDIFKIFQDTKFSYVEPSSNHIKSFWIDSPKESQIIRSMKYVDGLQQIHWYLKIMMEFNNARSLKMKKLISYIKSLKKEKSRPRIIRLEITDSNQSDYASSSLYHPLCISPNIVRSLRNPLEFVALDSSVHYEFTFKSSLVKYVFDTLNDFPFSFLKRIDRVICSDIYQDLEPPVLQHWPYFEFCYVDAEKRPIPSEIQKTSIKNLYKKQCLVFLKDAFSMSLEDSETSLEKFKGVLSSSFPPGISFRDFVPLFDKNLKMKFSDRESNIVYYAFTNIHDIFYTLNFLSISTDFQHE